MKRSYYVLSVALSVIILLAAVVTAVIMFKKKDTTPVSDTKFLLNTICSITLYDKQQQSLIDGSFDVISHYENLFSTTVEGSDIYKINHAAGEPVTVDKDTIDVINEGIAYSKESDGLFDITVGALTTLWNIEGENPKVPPEDQIKAAVATIGYENIVIDGNTVTLRNKETQLDLGGLAKGYIADKVKEYLVSQGVKKAIINLGGNVVVIGSKNTDTPWVVGVQQPFMDRNVDIGYLYVSDKSVVTSGIYERYFIENGKVYAHILDPRSGYPVENNLASVTIISNASKQGDGLAATCFLLGIDKATALVESMDEVEAIFITKDGKVVTTQGIGDTVKFEPADTSAVTSAVSPT
ncbi:FAD:protein FMN transferase [Oscillospiraceae bacterium WX1]